jgi:hypothetical protein
MLMRENNVAGDLWGEANHPFVSYLNLCPFPLTQNSLVQNSLAQRTTLIYSDLTPYGLPSEVDPYGYIDEFPLDFQAYSEAVLTQYLNDADDDVDKARAKLIRKMIRSAAVSMAGHLSFLVPRYKQISIETAAKDEVVHFEPITLAEDQERPNLPPKAIRMFGFGWRLCTKQLRCSSILAMRCWRTFCIPTCTSGGLVRVLPV